MSNKPEAADMPKKAKAARVLQHPVLDDTLSQLLEKYDALADGDAKEEACKRRDTSALRETFAGLVAQVRFYLSGGAFAPRFAPRRYSAIS